MFFVRVAFTLNAFSGTRFRTLGAKEGKMSDQAKGGMTDSRTFSLNGVEVSTTLNDVDMVEELLRWLGEIYRQRGENPTLPSSDETSQRNDHCTSTR